MSCKRVLALAGLLDGAAAARQHWIEAGAAPNPNLQHELIFAVPQNNLVFMKDFVQQVSNPASKLYGHYMTFDEVGEKVANFGATEQVVKFLQKQGIKTIKSTKFGEYITSRAPLSVWNRILNASFVKFLPALSLDSSSNGIFRSVSLDIPSELQSSVFAIFQGNDFPAISTLPVARTVGLTTNESYCDPPFLNKYYNFTSNDCQNQGSLSIFATGGQNMSPDDLKKFQRTYSIPDQKIDKNVGGNDDSSYSTAMAHNLTTWFWSVDKYTSFSQWLAQVAATKNPPLVHSISYGEDEKETPASFKTAFSNEAMKLAARGVTVIVSSGDDGVAGVAARSSVGLCDYNPQWPATCPYVTTVGATQGPEERAGAEEIVCQATIANTFITSGGGFSTFFDAPAYQKDVIAKYLSNRSNILGPGYKVGGRGYPDVSLIGHLYPTVIGGVGGDMNVKDGTSASTPVFAAIVAQVNGRRLALGKSPVGAANPALYGMAGTNVFRDIVHGKNNCCARTGLDVPPVCCPSQGFQADEGWDPTTGLGSVNVGLLVEAWVAL